MTGLAMGTLLGGTALFLQALYLPCKPLLVVLAVLTLALRSEPVTAGCWGWLLGILWGMMAGLPPVRLGVSLAAAAWLTGKLHHTVIFTPARLAFWTSLLVIPPAIVLQCFQSMTPAFVLTILLAPLTLWGAP